MFLEFVLCHTIFATQNLLKLFMSLLR